MRYAILNPYWNVPTDLVRTRVVPKIRAGASLLQLYSALIYEGPGLVGTIKRGLVERMRNEGLTSLAGVVGRDAKALAREA